MSDLTSKELTISDDGQVVTIFGIRYDIELFRHLGIAPVGARIEIIERPGDGTLTIKRLPDEPRNDDDGRARPTQQDESGRLSQDQRAPDQLNAATGQKSGSSSPTPPPGDVKPPKFHVGQQVRATGGYAVREVKRIFYRYEVTMADQMCGQFVCLDEKELVAADSSETKGVE